VTIALDVILPKTLKRLHDLRKDGNAHSYETAFTDKTPELAASVYRIPFPQNMLELIGEGGLGVSYWHPLKTALIIRCLVTS